VIPLHADYKPVITSTRPSLAYKSRRRRLKRGKKRGKEENRGGEGEQRRDRWEQRK
jgi:hypothetical protein